MGREEKKYGVKPLVAHVTMDEKVSDEEWDGKQISGRRKQKS